MDVADKKKQRTTDERGQPRIFLKKTEKKLGKVPTRSSIAKG